MNCVSSTSFKAFRVKHSKQNYDSIALALLPAIFGLLPPCCCFRFRLCSSSSVVVPRLDWLVVEAPPPPPPLDAATVADDDPVPAPRTQVPAKGNISNGNEIASSAMENLRAQRLAPDDWPDVCPERAAPHT